MTEYIDVSPMMRDALPAYNKIVRNLYMGSVNALRHAKKFDVIVSMAGEVSPPSGVRAHTIHVPLTDTPAGHRRYAKRITDLAQQIAYWVQNGTKVLIVCNVGLNRSALMTALVLMDLGYEPTEIIHKLRRRSQLVLSNQGFVDFLYKMQGRF